MSTERLVKGLCAAAGGLPIGGALAAAFSLLVPGSPASAADAFSTDWALAAKSRARLIAGGGDLAGFEIALSPGAITYWRNPGDAGLPPTLDFSSSDNVASVEPEFPAPKRIKEADGGEAFGYDGSVVFPLRVKPRDPTKPATLKLTADFAVCEKVCLPAKAHLEFTLPSAPRSPLASAIEAALATVPRAVAAKDFGALEALGADSWRLCAAHEDGPPRDLFVEAPEGWWMKVAPANADGGRDCFTLAIGGKPKDAALPVALRLTLTGGAGAMETTMQADPKT
ncbi:MAG TPA: protein-disulfide reductase DsbD domain-containing protein [Roseiarcus sp.]|nr:protein-disulfide reductase DsbD domain-containing protein [Roseiarcus sp.]